MKHPMATISPINIEAYEKTYIRFMVFYCRMMISIHFVLSCVLVVGITYTSLHDGKLSFVFFVFEYPIIYIGITILMFKANIGTKTNLLNHYRNLLNFDPSDYAKAFLDIVKNYPDRLKIALYGSRRIISLSHDYNFKLDEAMIDDTFKFKIAFANSWFMFRKFKWLDYQLASKYIRIATDGQYANYYEWQKTVTMTNVNNDPAFMTYELYDAIWGTVFFATKSDMLYFKLRYV